MGPKLAGAQVGGHTLALRVPQQPQGAITAGHTAFQLPTVFRLPAVATACWGTLLVLLATRTQDSWAQRHTQVRGCSAPLPPKENKASNLWRSEILLGPSPAAKPLDPLCWKECKGAAGWLSRLTAEGPVSPGRQGTLLGTAPSIGRKHRAQAVPARGAATHSCQAAQVERLPVHQPVALLGGRRGSGSAPPMDSPLPPPGAQQPWHGSEWGLPRSPGGW